MLTVCTESTVNDSLAEGVKEAAGERLFVAVTALTLSVREASCEVIKTRRAAFIICRCLLKAEHPGGSVSGLNVATFTGESAGGFFFLPARANRKQRTDRVVLQEVKLPAARFLK